MERVEAEFVSDGQRCAAWHYIPTLGGGSTCIVMANGLSLTRHDGLPHYAERFAAAGAQVVLFDYRHLGDSEGEPRQRLRRRRQRHDLRGAIGWARTLPGVRDVVGWGYSYGGGYLAQLAAGGERLAAALLVAPFVDGLARARQTSPGLAAWLTARALADVSGRHNLVPVTAESGERGAMNLPGEAAGFARATSQDSPWRNEISPGFVLTNPLFRPVARARRIVLPIWVGLGERDISAPGRGIRRLAERAADPTLRVYDLDHFDFLVADHARVVAEDQIAFLAGRGLL